MKKILIILLLGVLFRHGNTQLQFSSIIKNNGGTIRGLKNCYVGVISPDGKHLYTGSFTDDAVGAFSINSSTGQLTFINAYKKGIGGIDGMDGAHTVTISQDGNYVYCSSYNDNAIVTFSRNQATGELTYMSCIKNGQSGVSGLAGGLDIEISPNSKFLYGAGQNDDAVTIFSRNIATGQLTFIRKLKDDSAGVYCLKGAHTIAFSPDQKFMYVNAFGDNAIAVFSMDTSTGALTFTDSTKKGVGDVPATVMNGANYLTISSDGLFLYTNGWADSSIVVFSRNSTTGKLTYVQSIKHGNNNASLIQPYYITITKDGAYVFVSDYLGDAITIFSRNAVNGTLAAAAVVRDSLNGPYAILESLDSKFFYAVSYENNAAVVFSYQSPGIIKSVNFTNNSNFNVTVNAEISKLKFNVELPNADDYSLYVYNIFGSKIYESLEENVASNHQNLIFNNTIGNGLYIVGVKQNNSLIFKKFLVY